MKRLLKYLNPIDHLGDPDYRVSSAALSAFTIALLLTIFDRMQIIPFNIISLLAIFVFIVLIIYFSFRNGVKAGVITVLITIGYYFFIIYDHNYQGDQLKSGIETTVTLAFTYLTLAAIIGWLKQTIDILIERESDEKHRLQAIIDQMPVGVLVSDSNGKITHSSKQLEKIIGVQIPVGFQLGTHPPELQFEKEGKTMTPSQSPLARVVFQRIPNIGDEFVTLRKDGEAVYVKVDATLIRNEEEKIIAAVSIIHDITEQKNLETRKDDFVNMASHELKTPVTSLKLFLESLNSITKKYNDQKAQKIIQNIKNQTDRLQNLVNDLLDVSRIQTGKLRFRKELFRIDQLLVEVIQIIQQTYPNRQIKLDQTEQLEITADKFRIYQVITNILTNALKYSEQNKPVTARLYTENDFVVISVQDQGIGIAADQQDKIFERLYQVDDDQEKTFPGFGMGLYISREIISHHNGYISVQSEKGRGATFFIGLPLKPNTNE